VKDRERNEPIVRFHAVLKRLNKSERWTLLDLFERSLDAQLNRKSDDLLIGLRAMEDVLRRLAGGGFTSHMRDKFDDIWKMLEEDKRHSGREDLKANWAKFIQDARDAKADCPSRDFIETWNETPGTMRQKARAVQAMYGGTLEAHEKRARRYKKARKL
jgi:hypothetical protein